MSAIINNGGENASRDRSALAFRRLERIADMRELAEGWRRSGDTVALVPTMGALHEGHLSLVREAQRRATKVVVSIYVNPLQFGPNEDFDRYPRQAEEDCALLALHGVEAAWLPPVEEMKADGFATTVRVDALGAVLCGASRPGHSDGVATIVTQLLNVVRPDVALFGEKDWQQLAILRRLHRDLSFGGEIVGVPTMREADGLALSSRNRYLDEAGRKIAASLPAILATTAEAIRSGADDAEAIRIGRQALNDAGLECEYLELRDETDLAPLTHAAPRARLFAAVRIGRTRLIDNLAINQEHS